MSHANMPSCSLNQSAATCAWGATGSAERRNSGRRTSQGRRWRKRVRTRTPFIPGSARPSSRGLWRRNGKMRGCSILPTLPRSKRFGKVLVSRTSAGTTSWNCTSSTRPIRLLMRQRHQRTRRCWKRRRLKWRRRGTRAMSHTSGSHGSQKMRWWTRRLGTSWQCCVQCMNNERVVWEPRKSYVDLMAQ